MLAKLFSAVAPWAILTAGSVALFGILCAINRMHISVTRLPVAIAYVLIAIGWGNSIVAAIDLVAHRLPVIWPPLLVAAVLCLAAGNALLFLVDRRRNCNDCEKPGRGCP